MFNKVTDVMGFIVLVFMLAASPVWAADTAVLSLDESIRLAMNNNEQIKAAASGTEVARWNLEKAKGAQSISVDFSHTSSKIRGNYWQIYQIYELPSNYFVNSVSATMPLYSGGRIENTIKQAKLGSEISNLQLESVKQDIRYQVTQSY
ncbi:MAG TPA: TolC family protein, partial [Patescibacteria group bacterium]|nr:TolC family protein [Patescibacteria group bacterium]